MTELLVGIQHRRDDVNPQAPNGAPMSIIGLIGTAPDADAVAFPLNTAVLCRSNDATLRAKLGAAGTLEDAMAGISAQLDGVTRSATVVIVRIAEGVDAYATIANILGSESLKTGVWQFLEAGENLGYEPRLLIAPGYTSQTKNGVKTIAVTSGGSGYTSAPTVVFTGGGGSGAAATAVLTGDAVSSIVITNAGEGYTTAPTISFTGGAGADAAATSTIGINANAVCALMPTICGRLKGFFIPEGPTSSETAYNNWLETLPESETILHPIGSAVEVQDGEDVVTKPASPYAAGMYVKVDAETDGRPFRSIANRAVLGIVGVTPKIPLSLIDASSKGQDYLRNSAGIIVRGQSGVIGAVARSGFVFWGTDTLSADTNYRFANVARGRTFIELTNTAAQAYYLGRFNVTVQVAQAIINTLEGILSKAKAEREIIDFRISFDPELNQSAELKAGTLDITFNAEEAPVLRKISFRSRRYEKALDALAQQISIILGGATQA